MAVIKLHCQHRDEGGSRCDISPGQIQNGVLLVKVRHHGEDHVLALRLSDVERLLREDRERRDPVLRTVDTT